jgi:hypothetical protein
MNTTLRYLILPLLVGTLACVFYAGARAGLETDDAYIFLQYARNLAGGNGLAFNPGETSFGVTSILWVLLLAGAHLIAPLDWVALAQVLGGLCFAATIVLVYLAARRLGGGDAPAWLAAMIIALDGFMITSALSGMETMLNAALFAAVLWVIAAGLLPRRPLACGALLGLAYLCRPDNLACAGLAGLILPLQNRSRLFRNWGWLAVGFLLVAGPWLLILWVRFRSFAPPTGTGKLLVFLPDVFGFTYDEFKAMGFAARLGLFVRALRNMAWELNWYSSRVVTLLIALAAPGLAYGLFRLKDSRPAWIFLAGYAGMLILLYGFLFPLVKARYLVAAHVAAAIIVPAVTARLPDGARLKRPAGALLLLLLAVSAGRYRDYYARGVAHWQAAADLGRWLAAHSPTQAVVALEPIGAIGFYSQRRILDLGGLTDYSVWPYIRRGVLSTADLPGLFAQRGVNYMVDYDNNPWLTELVARDPGRYVFVKSFRYRHDWRGSNATAAVWSLYELK